jgi:Family of unknown function (DUF6074)
MIAVHSRIIGGRIITKPRSPSGQAAAVMQFPVLARRAFIARIAATMKRKRSDKAAENYLAAELRKYRRELEAAGIARSITKRELHAMEPAVRGELWRLMFGRSSGTGRRK